MDMRTGELGGKRTESQHFDMVIVGAGLSGIDAAYRFQTECAGKDYVILEARDAIGGTWDLFRYPGIRSDSDMYTLGFPFRPWSSAQPIADGGTIRNYIRETATEFGIDRHIRFGHRVISADWSNVDALWTVTVDIGGEIRRFTTNFLFMGSGYYDYDAGYTPQFSDINKFGGTFIHPQFWPENFAAAGKRIVVIGSGATAVTLVPALVDEGADVTMLQRSPTYIVARPGEDGFANWAYAMLPVGLADHAVRWKSIIMGIATFAYARAKPERMKQLILSGVREQLPENYEIERDFEPRYDPWDQRICLVPDADLFVALRSGKARIVTDHIDRFTETGILLRSGAVLPADVVVSATGLIMRLLGGVTLSVDGQGVDPAERMLYKGMMLSGVPNLALSFGYTNASWTLKCDLTARYACRLINHMAQKGFDRCTPVLDSTDVKEEPMLAFTSGYVERANAILPKQGSKAPWRVHQNYVLDLAALKFGSVEDGIMQFARRDGRKPSDGNRLPAPVLIAGAGAALIGGLALFSKITATRAEVMVPPDGDFMDLDGTRLHFVDKGEGPAIVMIHGLAGQMRNFGYAMFDRLAKDHRVILVDRPGSGYSLASSELGSNVRAQASVIGKLIERLNLDRPLIVGHSLGGAVALALALDHPDLVGALALIAPLSQPQDEPPEVFKALAIESPIVRRAVAWTVATPIGLAKGPDTTRAVFAPEPVPDDFRVKAGAALALRPSNFYAASSDLVAANADLPEMVARYRNLQMPVGILYGRDDAILDHNLHGRRLAEQITEAELTLMDGGHMIPITQPERVSDWVAERARLIRVPEQPTAIGRR